MSRLFLNCTLALTLAACSSIDARTSVDSEADFSSYRTFAMAPLPEKGPAHMPRYTRKRAENIWQRIADRISARGYEQVEGPDANLLVSFTVDSRQKTSEEVVALEEGGTLSGSQTTSGDIWYDNGWSDAVYSQHYVEGQVVIDVFDTARERVVWHGWVTAEIFRESDIDSKARKALDALLDRFPSR